MTDDDNCCEEINEHGSCSGSMEFCDYPPCEDHPSVKKGSKSEIQRIKIQAINFSVFD